MRVASLVYNNFTNDSRVEKQALSLSNSGFDLTVLGLWKKGLLKNENKAGFRIQRFKIYSSFLKGASGRVISFLEFSIKVSWRIRQVDVVHCHDFHPLPAMIVSKLLFGSLFSVVYDAHEFESKKLGLGKFTSLCIGILERISVKFIDGFITVSSSILNNYENLFPKIPKLVIFNCPPLSEIKETDLLKSKLNIRAQSVLLLYQGGFMPGRSIERLINAFEVTKEKNLDLVFLGYPATKALAQKVFMKILEAREQNERIHYHESVSSKILNEYTCSASIGICLIEDLCLSYKFCLPNKFFEYAMAGLPILVSDLPEMRKLVEKYDCGVVCESLTPDGIVNGLKKLLSRDLVKLGKNARKMAEDHSWEIQEKKLLRLYDKVLEKKAV